MGDRTTAELYVPIEFKKAVLAFIKEYDEDAFDEWPQDNLYVFELQGVDGGTPEYVADLKEAGIPYTCKWDDGIDYRAGEEHLRFDSSGEPLIMEVDDVSRNIDPQLLEASIAEHNSLDAVRQLLRDHLEKTVPLPWDNQVEYGQLFVSNQRALYCDSPSP